MDIKNIIKISKESYVSLYNPAPGFVLIEKDNAAEKEGSIYITDSVRKRMIRGASSGTVCAVSSIDPETDYQKRLSDIYTVGKRVGFVDTTPIASPLPPYYRIGTKANEMDRFVTVHIEDIIVLFDTEQMYSIENEYKEITSEY